MNTSPHWLILGTGMSGLGAASLLHQKKLNFLIADKTQPSQESMKKIQALGGQFFLGDQNPEALKNIDHLVVSPGFPPSNPVLTSAVERNIPIYSELDLALKNFTDPIIGITGTNGKSTTTAMIYHLLSWFKFSSTLGGNIGVSLAEKAALGQLKGIIVAELSSFQLHYSQQLKLSIGIITNLTPDHVAWHGSLDAYYQAKAKMCALLGENGLLVIDPPTLLQILKYSSPGEVKMPALFILGKPEQWPLFLRDKNLENYHLKATGFVWVEGEKLLVESQDRRACYSLKDFGLLGFHNKINAAVALGSFWGFCTLENQPIPDQSAIETALANFAGLSHRYEYIGDWKGLMLINDSKATNLDATLNALKSTSGKIHLLLGGLHKGEDFSPITQFKEQISQVFIFGAAKTKLYQQLNGKIKIRTFDTLNLLLNELTKMDSIEGPGTLLFAPGCASFDEFRNFEERGDFFKSFFRHQIGP